MKKLMQDFKSFVLRGNVMSLAVGVIIGAAFQGVVTSLTDNIISPIIGLFTKQNFDLLTIEAFGVSIKYGAFISSVINFIIMAFVVFLMARAINRLLETGKKAPVSDEPTTKKCDYCQTEISVKATRCPACTSQLSR